MKKVSQAIAAGGHFSKSARSGAPPVMPVNVERQTGAMLSTDDVGHPPIGSIAAHPCKKRKDGAPTFRYGEGRTVRGKGGPAPLYYNRARYYSSATGRFWTADSYEGNSRDSLSLHKYIYSEGNPVDHVDPSGNEIDEVLTVAAVVVTIAGITVLSACNATPPSATILKNEVVKDPWLGLYKDWAVQFKFPTDASQYVVVQWIEGSYTINGTWVETNSQGKRHNTDFEDWTIDSNSSVADYGTTQQSSHSLLLYDSPGNLALAPGQPVGALSQIRFNADYHFLDQVYKRSSVGTKCSDFNSPWDPAPILSIPWDFVDSYQIP